MMYDVIEAVLLEAHDLRSRVRSSAVGSAVGARSTGVLTTSRATVDATEVGRRIGDGARKLSAVVATLPVVSLTPDAIRHAYCVDLLAERWKSNRSDPLAAIQLAEALTSAQQAQEILRMTRVADPVSYLLGAGLRYGSRLGRNGTLPTAHRLARAAHRYGSANGGPANAADHLALARAYRLTGKPGLATRYASAAGRISSDELQALQDAETVTPAALVGAWLSVGRWRLAARGIAETTNAVIDRVEKAGNRLEASYTGDSRLIDPETRARMQVGAAWTTIAWALRDAGDRDRARSAATAALGVGFTAGNEVLAALVDAGDDNLLERVGKRVELLAKVSRRDRTFYRGRWRGSAWIAGATLAEQARKTRRLVDR